MCYFTFVPKLAFSQYLVYRYSVTKNWTKDVNGYKFWFSQVWRTFLVTLKNQLCHIKCVKWKLKGEILGFLNFFIRNGPSMAMWIVVGITITFLSLLAPAAAELLFTYIERVCGCMHTFISISVLWNYKCTMALSISSHPF